MKPWEVTKGLVRHYWNHNNADRLYDDCMVEDDGSVIHVLSPEQADFLLALVNIQSKDAGTIETSLRLADEALGLEVLRERF
jgi:hypothetical protein